MTEARGSNFCRNENSLCSREHISLGEAIKLTISLVGFIPQGGVIGGAVDIFFNLDCLDQKRQETFITDISVAERHKLGPEGVARGRTLELEERSRHPTDASLFEFRVIIAYDNHAAASLRNERAMKNKKKVEATVEICAGGLHVPEGSSVGAEITKLGRRQGIHTRVDLQTFVNSVKYRLKKNQRFSAKKIIGGESEALPQKEGLAQVPNKSYKLLLISIVIIAVLFVLFKTMFTVENEKPLMAEPRFRVCLTLFRDTVAGEQTVKTFSDD